MSPCGPSRAAQISRLSNRMAKISSDKGKAALVKGADRVGVDGAQDVLEQFVLDAFQHMVNVGVVQVEGRTVDVHQVGQFLYCHFLHAFLFHQQGKAVPQLGPCARDAPVRLLLHTDRPFFCKIFVTTRHSATECRLINVKTQSCRLSFAFPLSIMGFGAKSNKKLYMPHCVEISLGTEGRK